MFLFSNSEQAKGYALAQGEINTANALATTRSFEAALAANRMAATNQALVSNVHELWDALAAESHRADFFQTEADKLCAVLTGFLEGYERLAAENSALRAELDQARKHMRILAKQIPPMFDHEF